MTGRASSRARHTRSLGILAAVVGLHIAIFWLLWATTRAVSMRIALPNLEVMFITPDAQPTMPDARSIAPTRQDSSHKSTASTHPGRRLAAGSELAGSSPSTSNLTPSTAIEDGTAQSPIDWDDELSHAAGRPGAEQPAVRDFGFPHRDPKPVKAPEFGWSHAQTHRVESVTGGGVVININDNCAIVLVFPFALAGCKLGKRKANGGLFDHMGDEPTQVGESQEGK